MKKLLFLIIFFYIIVIIQTSFLAHFVLSELIFNFIIISVVLFNVFDRTDGGSGALAAILGGIFWDIFSGRPLGFYVLTLLGAAVLLKIIRRHVYIPSFRGI